MLLLLLLPLPARTQTPDPVRSSPVLQPGDALQITVFSRDDLSGEFLVSPEGYLIHPYYRDVQVSGVAISVVEDRVAEVLATFAQTPRFVVEPRLRIVVGGAVRQPGIRSVPLGTTVRQALFEAGGVTEQAVLFRAKLFRSGTVRELDLSISSVAELPVISGDEVLVDTRRSLLRDVVAPVSSVVGAVTAVLALVFQLR